MAIGEGKFKLYSSIEPPLEAGEWRFKVDHSLKATMPETTLTDKDLKIDGEKINVNIRSPRYVLPPDQVLSTYPPANSQGSYGSRLPQVVIKRRTLPWERRVDGAPPNTPWLALVLIAEGEAQLDTAVDVADCITPGVILDGIHEVAKGNRLVVRKSVIDKVFPTQNDVDLLAHAREVDIHDTELMMGDDDGFLAVVISNRLPVPGKDENGKTIPIKYLACLINLEGQFGTLLERSPDPVPATSTSFLTQVVAYTTYATTDDHHVMGTAGAPEQLTGLKNNIDSLVTPGALASSGSRTANSVKVKSSATQGAGANPSSNVSQWSSNAQGTETSAEISLQMAESFRFIQPFELATIDPEYRFPVLLHWSFTTSGTTTFRSLMENLDSRLLGDAGDSPSELSGRLPLEVAESGHVGLGHQTRDGDKVRSWYRGPLVPHPTLRKSRKRLDLAHSSDQLRIVVPDGREDLSLATAFETGRMLTLSQPSIIASLMRWRQTQYQVSRLKSLLEANLTVWQELLGAEMKLDDINKLGPIAGRFLVNAIVNQPEILLGHPRPLVTPGRSLEIEGIPGEVMSAGFGFDKEIFQGDIGNVLNNLQQTTIPFEKLTMKDIGAIGIREVFEANLNNQRLDLVSNVLSNKLIDNVLTGPAFPVTTDINLSITPDVLDRILASSVRDHKPSEEDQ